MERKAIMSDVELSYEELRCLEAQFRKIQKEAVVCTLKHSTADTVALVDKIISQFGSVHQLKSSTTES